jgi:hypothetical protein
VRIRKNGSALICRLLIGVVVSYRQDRELKIIPKESLMTVRQMWVSDCIL